MKSMKRRKLVGITIIIASILMQISYAASIGQINRTISTKELAVKFLNNPVVSHDQNIEVFTTVDEGGVNILASNLYPGGKFSVTSTVENQGEYDAVVTGVDLVENQGEGLSHELFTELVGYESNQSIEDYTTYLKNTYVGKVVPVGKTLDIPLVMGMSVEETGLQNQKTQFSLLIHFQQKEGSSGGGGNNGDNDSDQDSNQDTVTPDGDKDIPKQEVQILPSEMLIKEETVVPHEMPVEAKIVLPIETNLIENPVSKSGLLPKTGGITPIVVYGVGIVLLGSGIMIYRKKEE